jgi:hypothetical protein
MSVLSVAVSPAERRRAREFADLLEDSRPATGHELESLVALAASLRPAQFTPRAEFRASLRESLVAQAAARPVPAARVPAVRPQRRHRLRTAAASVVVVGLVGGVGAAAASTHALPGDPLYGLKRSIESAQLHFAHSDLSRGRALLDQANHRLSEAEDLAASDDASSPATKARIATAIADLTAATQAGTKAFDASYADTGDLQTLVELNRFVVDQQARLADLSAQLSPQLRQLLAPLSAQLVALKTRIDSLAAKPSAAPSSSGGTGTTGVGNPLTDPSAVAGTVDGLTGGASTTGGSGATGGLGKGGTATVPSALPHVSLPASPAPSASAPHLPLPSLTAPSLPLPSLPSIPLPNISVPVPISTPTLPPVNITPPACVPIPPLTNC